MPTKTAPNVAVTPLTLSTFNLLKIDITNGIRANIANCSVLTPEIQAIINAAIPTNIFSFPSNFFAMLSVSF